MSGSSRRNARSRAKTSPADVDADEPLWNRGPIHGTRKGRSRDAGPIRLMDVSLKTLLGLGFGFLALLFVAFLVWGSKEDDAVKKLMRTVTPLPAPKMMDLSQVKRFLANSEPKKGIFLVEIPDFSQEGGHFFVPYVLNWYSFKESTRRACTGEPTDPMCTLGFAPGTKFSDDLISFFYIYIYKQFEYFLPLFHTD